MMCPQWTIKSHAKSLSYHDSHRNDTYLSHMAMSNKESHVATLEKKMHIEGSY